MKKARYFLILSFAFLFITACKDNNNNDDTNIISDDNFYKSVGNTIIKTYVEIFNEVLDTMPVGNINVNVNILGGSVIITGTDAYDTTTKVTTADLIFNMTDIKYIYLYNDGSSNWSTELTLNGVTTYKGTFSSSAKDVTHHSDLLSIKGSVTYKGNVRIIDGQGAVDIARKTNATTVSIFGHTVAW